MLEQPEARDVVIGARLEARHDVGPRRPAEQMRVAFLQLEVVLDRHLPADLRDRADLAVLSLEDREETALLGQPRDLDRVGGVRIPSREGT